MMKKEKIGFVFQILLIVLFFVAFCLVNSSFEFDSDSAILSLIANDILSGNIFLKNWHINGPLYLVTLTPFFSLGLMFLGLKVSVLPFAISLMFVLTAFSTVFLLNDDLRKNNITNILFCFLLLSPVLSYWYSRYFHAPGLILMFLAFYFVNKFLKSDDIKNLYFAGVLLALCVFNDFLLILIGIIPFLILHLVKFLHDDIDLNKYKKISLMALLSFALGILLYKIYLLGGIESFNNSVLRSEFISYEAFPRGIVNYFQYILCLQGADFFSKYFFFSNVLMYSVYFLFAISGIILCVKYFVDFLKNQQNDFVNTILSIIFFILTALFLFTTFNYDVVYPRYLIFIPFIFAIVNVRFISTNPILKSKILYFIAAVFFAFSILCLSSSKGTGNSRHLKLANFLESHNLKTGISNFWSAEIITVTSKNKIKIHAVNSFINNVSQYIWFCKKNWYKDPIEFIVATKDDFNFYKNTFEYKEILFDGDFVVFVLKTPQYFKIED